MIKFAMLSFSFFHEKPDFSNTTFASFISRFGRAYVTAAELALREANFARTKSEVLKQNAEFAAGRSSWWAAINEFADLTDQEFSERKKGLIHVRTNGYNPAEALPELVKKAATPESMDWRDFSPSIVTPVKDQGNCGSCWAFASTAVIESHHALYSGTKDLLVLAPQTLVNCAPNPADCGGTGGCEGSIPELAFNYTSQMGIALESDLPYTAHDEQCDESVKKAVKVSGYVKLAANSAPELEAALFSMGPIAVNVAANWRNYGGGIFSGGCTAINCVLDHVVVATGYAKPSASSEGYWLIRNSWGASWGEDGYIRLSRKYDETTFLDILPAAGVGCRPFPLTQTVGGESGLLLDMSYPVGVTVA
uniref:Peptidase C1A papain C-terminal domain-containing protein n=1 Tax=Coccolithus braarudii TaxID=221442 RepID=A0A7S0Q0C6_9EUKA|mmetsp:Transcript_33736/g.71989  ORF Transcript_33736/g.71989 Transcript_33736/m.71989 type:complete len:365 (+) Transcript_33736:3-1097(+)